MSPDRRLIEKVLRTMRAEEKDSLVSKARAAESRDPKIDPISTDCLMASAGGAAALYRHVVCVSAEEVYFEYGNAPFGRDKNGHCTLKKWRQWATKATVQRWSSTEIYVPGAGWQLHGDILAAAEVGTVAAD